MESNIKLLDVVALTEDLPDLQMGQFFIEQSIEADAANQNATQYSLAKGQVGTVVEILAPDVFEVEFSDVHGRTYAMLSLRADQLMLLHHEPAKVASY